MMREVFVLTFVVKIISGQTCSLASKLEVEAESIRLEHGLLKSKIFIAADWKLRMLNVKSYSFDHSYHYKIRVLQDLAHNITYTENLDTHECVKKKDQIPIIQQHYKDAEKLETLYMGRLDHGINATVYRVLFVGTRFVNYTLSADCVPLYLTMVNKADEEPMLMAWRFLDYKDGIQDASVFKIPPNCKPVHKNFNDHDFNPLEFGSKIMDSQH